MGRCCSSVPEEAASLSPPPPPSSHRPGEGRPAASQATLGGELHGLAVGMGAGKAQTSHVSHSCQLPARQMHKATFYRWEITGAATSKALAARTLL